MKVGKQRDGKGTSMVRDDAAMKRRLFIVMLCMFLFTAVSSVIVEASAGDTIRQTWGQVRVYVASAPFWINAVIIFAVGFLLYTLLLSDAVGKGGDSSKVMMYILLGVIALIIATKFIGANGAPEYLWRNDQFRHFTQFLIGPGEGPDRGQLTCSGAHSGWRSWINLDPNPPCCGTGSYWTNVQGERVCKQAILRTGEGGTGLPALIVAFLALYLLFAAFGKNLGFDSMGAKGGKWFPIVLSFILAAMIANGRVPKNNVLMIAGWVAFILIGNKLSKSMGGDDKEKKGSKKGFAFGLAYALIQLILNMLGTSLWGGSVSAGEFGTGSVIKNILFGMFIGYMYSALTGGKGMLGKVMEARKKAAEEDIEILKKKRDYKGMFLRGLPIIGTKWTPKNKAEDLRKKIKELTDDLTTIHNLSTATTPPPNAALRAEIQNKITRLQNKLRDELRKSP